MPRRVAILLIACAVGAGASLRAQQAQDPRAQLNEVQRLSSVRNYDAAMALFEEVRRQQPSEVTTLDGLKMVAVYAHVGNERMFNDLTRWMVERWKAPKTATDAERSVKGYIVSSRATDQALLAHAVEMATFASERAAQVGEGQYQGFFDTSRGIALYRAGRYADAAEWLPKTVNHQSVYVRTLALPFYAMTEQALGKREHAAELMAQARREAARLPAQGTPDHEIEWTDILITQMVMREAEEKLR